MSAYNLSLTLDNILTITRMFLDVFVMWLLLYYAIKIVRNNSRTVQIFKGIILVVLIDALAKFLGLTTIAYVADMFINWGFLAIIIVFQPEIRSILERLGKSNVFSRITTLSGNEKEHLVNEIVKATMLLSRDQTGALICIEQSHSLSDFIKTGTPLNSVVTTELLASIFVTTTPLHDGAVIIQGDRIACASAYFPPTNIELPSRYGARHRAAIGISEITDSVTIVVSEETGNVSIAEAGKIFVVTRKQLRDYLMRVICGEETEINTNSKPRSSQQPPMDGGNGGAVVEEPLVNQIPEQRTIEDTKQDTSVLSKLAIKKQENKTNQKIQPAEIVKATDDGEIIEEKIVETPEVIIKDTTSKSSRKKNKKNKKGRFAFVRQDEPKKQDVYDQEDKTMDQLEEESNNIKLPQHYKGPSIPSWVNDNHARATGAEDVEQPKEEPVFETPEVEEPVVETASAQNQNQFMYVPNYQEQENQSRTPEQIAADQRADAQRIAEQRYGVSRYTNQGYTDQRTVNQRNQEQRNTNQQYVNQRTNEQIIAEQRAIEQRAAAQKAAEQRAIEQRAAAQKAAEQRAAAQREAEQRAAEQRAAAQREAEQRAAEQRAIEQRLAAQKAAEQRVAEQRAAEQRAAEQRAAAQRVAEARAAEQRAAAQRVAEARAAAQREAEQRAAAQRVADQRYGVPQYGNQGYSDPRYTEQRYADRKTPEQRVPQQQVPEQRYANQQRVDSRTVEQPVPQQRVPQQRVPQQPVPEQRYSNPIYSNPGLVEPQANRKNNPQFEVKEEVEIDFENDNDNTFLKDVSKKDSEHTEFDTTKIDFSRFSKDDSDLDEQLAMLDDINVDKNNASNKGGDR